MNTLNYYILFLFNLFMLTFSIIALVGGLYYILGKFILIKFKFFREFLMEFGINISKEKEIDKSKIK